MNHKLRNFILITSGIAVIGTGVLAGCKTEPDEEIPTTYDDEAAKEKAELEAHRNAKLTELDNHYTSLYNQKDTLYTTANWNLVDKHYKEGRPKIKGAGNKDKIDSEFEICKNKIDDVPKEKTISEPDFIPINSIDEIKISDNYIKIPETLTQDNANKAVGTALSAFSDQSKKLSKGIDTATWDPYTKNSWDRTQLEFQGNITNKNNITSYLTDLYARISRVLPAEQGQRFMDLANAFINTAEISNRGYYKSGTAATAIEGALAECARLGLKAKTIKDAVPELREELSKAMPDNMQSDKYTLLKQTDLVIQQCEDATRILALWNDLEVLLSQYVIPKTTQTRASVQADNGIVK